jgi:pentapeptide repeat protein
MGARLRSWWQKIQIHPVRTVLIALLAVVIVLIILSILGYILNWGWTGLGTYISPPYPKDSTFQRGKTLWDWLQLLIIPAVLAVAGYVINLTISRGEQAATEQRAKSEREAADKLAKTEQDIAKQRYEQDQQIALDKQREDLLQAYLDRMSELLLKEQLRSSAVDAEVRNVARVRTITVLTQLDARRIGYVFAFLREAKLMSVTKDDNAISLKNADLQAVDWSQADLRGANLRGANLNGAIFFSITYVPRAFSGTIVISIHADLSGANLRGAKVTDEQLAKAASLEGAIMPDGSLHD